MISKRDPIIDLFKGFTIIWIIHTHTVFWSGYLYLPNIMRQLSLFIDVPIFFFLSGYVFFFGSLEEISKRSFRQLKRLYSTYLILALVVFLLGLLARIATNAALPPFFATIYDILIFNVDFPEFRGLYWNLWFLRTYLALIIIVPIFAFWPQSMARNLVLFMSAFVGFQLLGNYEYTSVLTSLPIYVSFYGAFFFLGSIFRQIETRITARHYWPCLLLIVLLVMLVFHVDDYKLTLQAHKFPPSLPYFIYSLPYLCLFVFVKCLHRDLIKIIPLAVQRFFIWSSHEVFNIYLIQSLICLLPYLFIPWLKPWLKGNVTKLLLYGMTFLFNLFFTILVVWLLKQASASFARYKSR